MIAQLPRKAVTHSHAKAIALIDGMNQISWQRRDRPAPPRQDIMTAFATVAQEINGATVLISPCPMRMIGSMAMQGSHLSVDALFRPLTIGALTLPNRIVMPPMGVHWADDGVPDAAVAQYYRRRAEGGAGLIITEGTFIDHPVSGHNPGYLRLNTEATVAGWTDVVRHVHEAGGLIMPELWHCGLVYPSEALRNGAEYDTSLGFVGPSGYLMPGQKVTEPMTRRQIEEVIEAFVRSALSARRAGFDGIELHGAHGFLIDQFFWDRLNERADEYGGSMRNRARFGADVIREVRRAVGNDCPISMRISQWKMQDFDAKVARSPQELADWVEPLVDAGLDFFDCSQRRYWLPEFEGSDLSFAGWVKKVSGKPVITVGAVGLNSEMSESLLDGKKAHVTGIERLLEMMERDEFDMVAVGRSLIADPEWPKKVASGKFDELVGFTPQVLKETSPTYDYL